MAKERIGFIGLGIMGLPMARNLAEAGYPLVVYNRTRSKAEKLQSDSVQIVESAADVARQSQTIITIVSDSPAVEEVVAGKKGLIEEIQPGSVVIDMSTIAPAVEEALDDKLNKKSSTLVDAPVSGGDVGAQKGTLSIMAGGDEEAFQQVRPLFEVMGETITYCGPVGNGQRTKLCNQILVSLNLLAVSEALAFARKSGLDPEVMISATRGGAAGSWQLANLGPKIAQEDYSPGFFVDLMQKDLKLVMEAANRVQASLPGASLVHQFFNGAQARGLGKEGTQALAKIVAALSDL